MAPGGSPPQLPPPDEEPRRQHADKHGGDDHAADCEDQEIHHIQFLTRFHTIFHQGRLRGLGASKALLIKIVRPTAGFI
jgi:hypothetical protein